MILMNKNSDNQSVTNPVHNHKKQLTIGITGAVIALLSVIAVIIWINSNMPKVVYQPSVACDLFTTAEAKQLLGANAIHSGISEPVLSGNTASSNCGYTDGNPDTKAMIVAAVVVRSGVNEKGVARNKTEFAAGRPTTGIEIVKDVGESAYFNKTVGQLNVLDGRRWIIVSYGTGATPETNNVADTVRLARLVLS